MIITIVLYSERMCVAVPSLIPVWCCINCFKVPVTILLHEDCVMLSLIHHILVAYWPVYESADREFWFIKLNAPVVVDSLTGWIKWQLWYNYVSVKCSFISWYTLPTIHKRLLPFYAPVACTSQKEAEWSEKVSTSHGNHSIQSTYHTTFLFIFLCECTSVLTLVCPSVSCKAPYDIMSHTAEYINSPSSLIHWCQLLMSDSRYVWRELLLSQ